MSKAGQDALKSLSVDGLKEALKSEKYDAKATEKTSISTTTNFHEARFKEACVKSFL